MDDYSWYDGGDQDFGSVGSDDWNLYDDQDSDYNMNDWWSDTGGNTDSGDWSYDMGGGSYGDYTGGQDPVDGNGAGQGYNWGGLVGPAVQGAGSYLSAVAQGKMSKEQLELAERLQEKAYAAKLAEDEKYYQSHGKQLSDAYQKYKGYYVNPNDPANQNKRETNIFGLLTPHPTTGPLANGW